MNILLFPHQRSRGGAPLLAPFQLDGRRAIVVGLFSLGCLAPAAASAEPPPGQLLASQCAQCHGTNGTGYESIAGDDHFSDLIAMKYRRVENIMDRHVRGYTDYQLRLIADYYRDLPGGGGD